MGCSLSPSVWGRQRRRGFSAGQNINQLQIMASGRKKESNTILRMTLKCWGVDRRLLLFATRLGACGPGTDLESLTCLSARVTPALPLVSAVPKASLGGFMHDPSQAHSPYQVDVFGFCRVLLD